MSTKGRPVKYHTIIPLPVDACESCRGSRSRYGSKIQGYYCVRDHPGKILRPTYLGLHTDYCRKEDFKQCEYTGGVEVDNAEGQITPELEVAPGSEGEREDEQE